MQKKRWLFNSIYLALLLITMTVSPVLAHDSPEGSEWVMADWMFSSFILFAGAAFIVFLFALKAGLLSNLEDAKFHILEIEEDDYYTPDWAQEGGD